MKTLIDRILVSIFLLLLPLAACKADITRNSDGSYNVETTISQQELQDVISASIADPLIKDITVSLQSGYILAAGERARLNDSSKTDTLTFRLDMAASNGQLSTTISNAQIDGIPVEQDRVDLWNERIASRLAKIGQKNATLLSLSITPNAVTMTWNVSK